MNKTAARAESSRHAWVVVVALVCLTLALYSPVRRFSFTNYDDNDYVSENPMVLRGLTGETIRWAFTTGHAANWHPITWLSHAFDVTLSNALGLGSTAAIHHLNNAVLHAVNAGLLFWLLRNLTGVVWPCALVAALFAAHPLNVQSVAWIAERKNVLSTFFGLLSLLAYSSYANRPSLGRYIPVALWLALGLMSKPMLVTWPFVMLLLDFWPLRRTSLLAAGQPGSRQQLRLSSLLTEKAPLFAMIIVSSIVTFVVQRESGAVGSAESIPVHLRLQNAVVAYLVYIAKTVWPFGLAAFYPHPMESLALWKVVASLLVLTAGTFAVIRALGTRPYLATGWFWYLGTLVPVIGIVQVGGQAYADRYAYVPLIGLFIMAAWGLNEMVRAKPASQWILSGAAGVCLVFFSVRTAFEQRHWANDVTLWQHAVDVTTNNHVAHNNLGTALQKDRNRIPEAVSHFQEALRIQPSHAGSLINVGSLLMRQGKYQEAVASFEAALRSNPNSAAAHLNLAQSLMQLGRLEEAEALMERARAITPLDAKIYNAIGVLCIARGEPVRAEEAFRKALELRPDYQNARDNLARLKSMTGRQSTP